MLVVQVVELLWSKTTRHAAAAQARAALPRAFGIDLYEGLYLLHHIRMAEWEDFSPRRVQGEARASVPSREGGLAIRQVAPDSYRLGLVGNPSGGQPHRHPVNEALTLHSGEFARLVVNGRHSSYSGQWYSEYVYNVACGETVRSDRFLQGAPEHQFSLAGNLF